MIYQKKLLSNITISSLTVKNGPLIHRTQNDTTTSGRPTEVTNWEFNSETRELTLKPHFWDALDVYDAPLYLQLNPEIDYNNITLTVNYSDASEENPNSDFAYVAIAPVIKEGSLDRFADKIDITASSSEGYDPLAGSLNSIWETVDEGLGALEDSIYYEWGQTFRCVNGAHTTSQDEVVLVDDKIQLLYEQKAQAIANAIIQETTLVIREITTDLYTGFYDVSWFEKSVKQTRRNVPYTKNDLSENTGSIVFPQVVNIPQDTLITITDVIPEYNEDGTLSGLEVGDPILVTATNTTGEVVIPLTYFNCFNYPFGVEETKIRSNFNATRMSPGIRASVVNESYRRRDQIAHVIHSGIFNDDISLNRLNEFNRNNQIEWELEINSGSIQKLHARDTNLVIFQENKVKNMPINKNLLQDANGRLTTTRSPNFFNTERSYDGEYGISRNPESFATYGNRMYFADKDRGALLRLAGNSIEEISQKGTESYVRDVLSKADLVICSYDDNKDKAHFSFRNRPEQPALTSVHENEFVMTVGACPDPRAECNIVDNYLTTRDLGTTPTMRVYSFQEEPDPTSFPLYGLNLGDVLFSDPDRTIPITGNYRWYLLVHEAQVAIPADLPNNRPAIGAIPPNNYAVQISPDGNITGLELNCQVNRPPDLSRQRFGMSTLTFKTPQEACASGVVEGIAFHNGGERRPPEKDETIYAGRYDIQPLYVTGYKLVTVDTEKYIIELEGGVVKDTYDCDTLALGRKPILGSHPILIPYGTPDADRNLLLCDAPFAEEVYWFAAETELPEIGAELFENDHDFHPTFGPWTAENTYVDLAGSGQYVTHNEIIWKKLPNTLATSLVEGERYKITSVISENWSSVGITGTAFINEVFTSNTDLDTAALALLGTVTLFAEPSFENPNWRPESGYVYLTFENGYFCAIDGFTGAIITYGNCSEVLCFANPDDLLLKDIDGPAKSIRKDHEYEITSVIDSDWTPIGGPAVAVVGDRYISTQSVSSFEDFTDTYGSANFITTLYDYIFHGIAANYTISTTGTNTVPLIQLSPIRGAEINYVVQGDTRRYPDTGSLQINAEDSFGNVSYSPIFDTSQPRETIDGADLQTLFLEAGAQFRLPKPQEEGFEDEVDPLVQLTSLCYRGAAFNSVGDPLDIIPNPPTITSIEANPSRAAEVGTTIVLTAFATDSDGSIQSYRWDSVDADGNITTLDTDLTVTGGQDSQTLTVSAATQVKAYPLRLTVTDTNIIRASEDITLNFYPTGLTPPTVTIQADGTTTESFNVEREISITLSGSAVADGTDVVTAWDWSLPNDVTLVSGDKSGTNDTIGDIVVISNSALENQTVTLAVTVDTFAVGIDTISLTWDAKPDDGREPRAVLRTFSPLGTGINDAFDACDTTSTTGLYYDRTVTPIQYFTNQGFLTPFDGQDKNWGVSVNVATTEVEGGAKITEIQTIDSNGFISETVPVLCAAPYNINLGYTAIGNNTTYVSACSSSSTAAFIDQPPSNFGGASEENRAKVIYTRKANGVISPAPDGFYAFGDHIIEAENGFLSATAVPFGCSRSKTYQLSAASGGGSVNVDYTYSPSDGNDVKNIGSPFSVSATVIATGNNEISGTTQWTASGGTDEPAEQGTGDTYTWSGIAEGTDLDTENRQVLFTAATTATGPTTYNASLTGSIGSGVPSGSTLSFSNGANGNTTTQTGILAGGSISVYIGINAPPGEAWDTYPTATISGNYGSGTVNLSGSSTQGIYAPGGTISSENKSGTVTFTNGSSSVPVQTSTVTLSASRNATSQTELFFTGGSASSSSVSASGNNGTSTILTAGVRGIPGEWVVGTVISNRGNTNPYSYPVTFGSTSNGSVVFTCSNIVRPTFTAQTGLTAAATCTAGTTTINGTLGGPIYQTPTSVGIWNTTFFYRTGGRIYLYNNGSTTSTNDDACSVTPPADNETVSLKYNSGSASAACMASAVTRYLPPGESFGTATDIYTGLNNTTPAANGFYSSGTSVREYQNGAFTSTTVGTCPTNTGTINVSPVSVNIANANSDTSRSVTVTLTGTGNLFTVTPTAGTPSDWTISGVSSTGSVAGTYTISLGPLPSNQSFQNGVFIFAETLSGTSKSLTINRTS